jgi:ATP-dependent Zn protease
MTRDEEIDVAHHEAAHAVVAVVLDVPLDEVTIVPSGDAAGSTTHPSPLMVDDPDPYPTRSSLAKLVKAMATGQYAGRAADRRRGCEEERKYAADDENAWELLCNYVRVRGATNEAYNRLVQRLRREADRLVAAHWPQVEALARVLLERKTMSGEEVLAVVAPS